MRMFVVGNSADADRQCLVHLHELGQSGVGNPFSVRSLIAYPDGGVLGHNYPVREHQLA